MHRHLTLIFALSFLFTIVLPIHALAGSIESHGNVARMHNRMLKRRGNSNNPLAALLGDPNSQAGNGGAANVESAPSQSGNPSTSDGTGDNTPSAAGQSGSNGGTTANGAGSTNGNNPSVGNTNTGNTGSTSGNTNSDSNQSGNSPADGSQQGGLASVVSGILGDPKSTSSSPSATSSKTASTAANSTSATTTGTSTSSSSSTTSSSSPTVTPSTSPTTSSSSSIFSLPSSSATTSGTSSSTTPSQTAPATEDDSNPPSGNITRNTIVILVAIGASIGVAAIVWTVIRKWKFRPSSNFEGRMQPIDWQPTTHDDDDIIANRLNRNASTRSHGSFTSGNGHSGANDSSLVADLPPLDAMGGSNHLAPVGGYANLQRGPSPQPMFELSNPHQFPVSQQQQYYNPSQGTAYGY